MADANEKTVVRLFTEADTPQVLDLFERNTYYVGLLDQRVTPEEYLTLQKARGTHFAGVIELDGKIIAHVAVYYNEASQIARPYQVYMSSLVIDAPYRKYMFSLVDLYKLVINHLHKVLPGVTEMHSLVDTNNSASAGLQRMFGSIMLNEVTDPFNQLDYINYSPSFFRNAEYFMETKHQMFKFQTALLPQSKRNLHALTPVVNGRMVEIEVGYGDEKLTGYPNIYSGTMCGVTYQIHQQELMLATPEHAIRIKNNSDAPVRWGVYAKDAERRELQHVVETLEAGEERLIPFPPETVVLDADMVDDIYASTFFPQEDWLADPYVDHETTLYDGVILSQLAGNTVYKDGESVLFKELWPAFTAPYLLGGWVSNLTRGLRCESLSDGTLRLTESREGYTVCRDYVTEGTSLRVHTWLESANPEGLDIHPHFELFLQDKSFTVDIREVSGNVTHKVYNYAADRHKAQMELTFENVVKEPYSLEPLSAIDVQYAQGAWRVTAEKPFHAFIRYNIMGIQPYLSSEREDGVAWLDGKLDFGWMRFDKMN